MLPAWQALDLQTGRPTPRSNDGQTGARGSTLSPRRIASLFVSSISSLSGPGHILILRHERSWAAIGMLPPHYRLWNFVDRNSDREVLGEIHETPRGVQEARFAVTREDCPIIPSGFELRKVLRSQIVLECCLEFHHIRVYLPERATEERVAFQFYASIQRHV